MKKIKFLGTAILAASLLFAGCTTAVEDSETPDDTTPVAEGTEEITTGGGSSSGGNNGGGSSGGNKGGSKQPVVNFTAPDLTDYYKNYYVNTPYTGKLIADWGAGSIPDKNDDGTWSIAAGEAMWWSAPEPGKEPAPKIPGICAPFTGIAKGSLAGYEYLVFTVDTTNFVIDNTDDGPGNYGVNVKIPAVQADISSNYVENGKLRTYYAPMTLFENAPESAVEFALIIAGTGTLKLNEVYFAAADNPATREVTGIKITPESATVAQGGAQQFTVKDSNSVNRTNDEDVAYTITGDAAEGSRISNNGLLTVGTTAGNLTVTATYTVGNKTFTSSATITVMEAKTNLVSSVELELYKDSTHDGESMIKTTGDIVSITDNTVTLNKPENSAWNEWSCQLFLKVTSDTAKLFEAGKKYYVSVTVTSSEGLDNCIWKEDIAGSFFRPETEFKAGEPTVLTAEITGVETDYFKCIFAFPGAASTITISDITVYDITESAE